MNHPHRLKNSFNFDFSTDSCNAASDWLQPTVCFSQNVGNDTGQPNFTRYFSDESNNRSCLSKNEQGGLRKLSDNNKNKKYVPLPGSQYHNLKNTAEYISSERIEMFVKEANIQSQDDRLVQLPTCNEPDDLKLISFLEKFEKQTKMSSNNPHEPDPLMKAFKFDAPPSDNLGIAANPATTTFPPVRPAVEEGDMVPDSIVSDKSNSSSAKLNSCKNPLPIRPLNAYNYFFADERERILSGKGDDVYDEDKKQRLLLQHLTKDRSKPRQHRKTHGKINFTSLSRMIGQRWKKLPEHKKRFYKDISTVDWTRYRREMNERIKQTVSRKPDERILTSSRV